MLAAWTGVRSRCRTSDFGVNTRREYPRRSQRLSLGVPLCGFRSESLAVKLTVETESPNLWLTAGTKSSKSASASLLRQFSVQLRQYEHSNEGAAK